jgi:hypothetical protein
MNTILNFINEKETELREIIETLVVSRLNEQARHLKNADSYSTIYIDREDGSFHVYERTRNSSRPDNSNLKGLISIDDYVATWGEENTFSNYLDVWFNIDTPADIYEELIEQYPNEFEDYIREGINYFMACFDTDEIIAEIKDDMWRYE